MLVKLTKGFSFETKKSAGITKDLKSIIFLANENDFFVLLFAPKKFHVEFEPTRKETGAR